MPPPEPFRFPVRIRPRARSEHVGGTWGPDGVLLAAVQAPAVDGKANKAVLRALATALEISRRNLRIVGGERSRDKLVEVADPPADMSERLGQLLSI
ncbi:MAG TPA: DUF167 domain-containing protein [Acidimicrobiales bacterium]|nr:DUF167 domain-containing protein [Acidimicrobiales bacterium]HJL89958.1 DUF167 domain-containing protein [Acidimicrobiales bacterium]